MMEREMRLGSIPRRMGHVGVLTEEWWGGDALVQIPARGGGASVTGGGGRAGSDVWAVRSMGGGSWQVGRTTAVRRAHAVVWKMWVQWLMSGAR
jgi:hypothetical protein